MNDESFPQEIHERNAVYYRGEDKDGYPICMYLHFLFLFIYRRNKVDRFKNI